MEKFNGNWVGYKNQKEFKYTCNTLTKNLSNFKTNKIFNQVIGSDVRGFDTALNFFNYIKNNAPFLLEKKNLDIFLKNENIGNPKFHKIESISIPSGTLIHLKILSDLLKLGPTKSVVEIGSGYGGQCKIIKDFLDVEYTCIDIDETLSLAKSYLFNCNKECTFIPASNVPQVYTDLCISNYALSELDIDGIKFYQERVINNCSKIYISVGNFISESDTHKYLIKSLKSNFDIQIHTENPKTSSHNNIFITGIKI